MAVERSLHGNLLRYANPDWLRTIARGQRMVMWGVWMVVAYIPFIIMVIVTFGFILAGKVSVVYENTAMYVSTGLLLIGLLLGGIGAIIATAAEPSAADRESPWSSRLMMRYGVIAAIVVGAIHLGLSELTVLAGFPIASRLGWSVVAFFIAFACAAMFRRFGELARRIPDAGLEKRLRKHFRYVIWSVPLLFLGRLFYQRGAGGMTFSDVVAIIVGLVLLVAGCTVLVLLFELCKTMLLFNRRLRTCLEPSNSAQTSPPSGR